MITVVEVTKTKSVNDDNKVVAEFDAEPFMEILRKSGVLDDEENDDRTYLIELDQDEYNFLMDFIEDEIVEADTVETTVKYVHLRDKLKEAEDEND